MNRPPKVKVSVVIPAFNAERFIADAIKSVLSQSYQQVECVVVDDGSTDRTAKVVRSFGDRVRLLSQSNTGVAAARNSGFAASTGSLIAFLDADDLWVRSKLERQIALMDNSLADLCYTAMYRVDERLRVLELMPSPIPGQAGWNTLSRRQPSVFLAQTGLVTRDAFLQLGGFNERLSTAADYEFTLRLMKHHEVVQLESPLALYRMHHGQMHLDVVGLEKDTVTALACLVEQGVIDARVEKLVVKKLAFDLGVHALSQRNWKEFRVQFCMVGIRTPPLVLEFLTNRLKRSLATSARTR